MSIAPRSAPLNPPLSAPPEPQPARPHIAERQEARRRQILDTAAQLFYSKGYPGMTMNDLCRALGVTKPAVYYYFTDKYEIFDILCRESAQTCLPVLRETADPRRCRCASACRPACSRWRGAASPAMCRPR